MAILEIRGVVKKVNASCFVVAEKVQIPGYEFEKSYTVWSKDAPPEGTLVVVKGKMTMKIKTYELKTFSDISINDPTIEIISPNCS
jgi:hypothetical protein